MASNMIHVEDLVVKYGDALAVDGISFDVAAGECLAILGANGAGKSTVAKALSGVHKPTSGTIEVNGESFFRVEPHLIARKGLAYLPEGRGIFPNLTVAENITLAARRLGTPGQTDVRSYDLFPVLGTRRKQIASTLSGGEQQMLAVARALIANPTVMVVDELSLGLAPLIIDDIYEALTVARKDNVTIVLIEQYVERALAFADRAMLMQRGKAVWTGAADGAADNIIHSYLGGEAEGAA